MSRPRLPAGFRHPLALLARRPLPLAGAFALMLAAGSLEGFGLLLLIPMLVVVGIEIPGGGTTGAIAELFERGFLAVGLPLTLPVMLLTYVLLVAAQGLVRYQESVRTAALVESHKTELRERVFGAVAVADWSFHLGRRSSDVLQVLTEELGRVGTSLDMTLRAAASTVTVTAYLAVALYLSPSATGIALLTSGVLLVLLKTRRARSRAAGQEYSEASESLYASIAELLAGLKTAKSHADEDRHTRGFEGVSRALSRSWVDTVRSYAEVQLLFSTGAVIVLSLLVWTSVGVLDLPAATLLVLIFVFLRVIPRVSSLQGTAQYLGNAVPAHERVEALLTGAQAASEPARRTGVPAPPALGEGIRLNGVTLRYPEGGDRAPVRGVTLEIPALCTTALVGPSGSGKTTLADAVIGLLLPEEGEVLVDGVPLDRIEPRSWRAGIGYVPQESFLFNDTIRANLAWAAPGTVGDDALHAALRSASLEGFVEGLPRGLDTVVGERGVRLSGGERQRLALARALLRRPRLLVLDEATSALDFENEAAIRSALHGLRGEVTVLMITHRLPLVREVDRIHVMEDGRLVESGCWDALMEQGLRFREMAGAQGAW